MAEKVAAEVQDGRVQRGARNRELILDALFTLVASGDLQPTAEEVAQQAGVGTRTVFRHFDDMESLYAEMSARVELEIRPLLGGELPDGDLGDLGARVAALVDQRALIFERISPFLLSAQSLRHDSRFLAESHARFCRILRADLEKAFMPELEKARGQLPLLDGLDLVASFEAWNRLRNDQGLGRARAGRVVQQSLLAIFSASGVSN